MSAKIKSDQLLAYIFDDKPHPLAARMSRWIDSSHRYKDFANEYRDKIRKKVRITRSDSGIQDLTAELETAYQLVRQKRFTVAYEPYGSERTRGPDFAVTFKSQTFNIEVTRIDSSRREMGGHSPGFDPEEVNGRIMDTVCDKLSQMRPGMYNVLLVVTDSDFCAALDLEAAMAALKGRVERKEEALYSRYGFEKPADFFKYHQGLSGILLRAKREKERINCSGLWINNQAKHELPGTVWTILGRDLQNS